MTSATYSGDEEMVSNQRRKRQRKERPTKNWTDDFQTLKEKLEYDGKHEEEERETSVCERAREDQKSHT